MSDAKEYDCQLKTMPVRLKGADGVVRDHYLEQLCVEDKERYLEFQKGKFQRVDTGITNDEGVPLTRTEILDYKDLEAYLISLMLHVAADKKLVSIDTIRKYPSPVASGLYEDCERLNEDHKEAKEDAKNE